MARVSYSTPLAILTSATDVLTYSTTIVNGAYVHSWPYVSNTAYAAILCIDSWGAGGPGGFGLYSATGKQCGGGGGSAGFTRVFIQLYAPRPVDTRVVSSTLTITSNGFTLGNIWTAGGGSSAVVQMPSGAVAAGGNYIPAASLASAAAAGSAGPGAPAQPPVSPDTGQPTLSNSVIYTGAYTAFPTPVTTIVQGNPINHVFSIINSFGYLYGFQYSGGAGRSGANGGDGALPIVAGGFSAGGGGSGTGRDKNGVTSPPGGPMTVVYLIAIVIEPPPPPPP